MPDVQTFRYRGCSIRRRWLTKSGRPQPDEWEWVHDEYDGPGDNRCGYEPTLIGCYEMIDCVEDE